MLSLIVRVPLLLLIFDLACSSQDFLALVRTWLPSAVGDRWAYEEEILGGDRANPEVERWEQEDVTVAVETIPEGVLIRRKVSYRNNTAPPQRVRGNGESNILVAGGCVYYLEGYWGARFDDFRKELTIGIALPDVCFPLRAGKTWGHPDWKEGRGRDLWTVGGFGKKKPDDPASVRADSWRLEAHLSSGEDNDVWFEPGTGVVAKRAFHNGTYGDWQVRLVSFEPGRSAR